MSNTEWRHFTPLKDTEILEKMMKEKGLSREDLTLIFESIRPIETAKEPLLVGLQSLHMGLTQKQEYLSKGIVPLNLPHSIFLEEDISQLEYLISILKNEKLL